MPWKSQLIYLCGVCIRMHGNSTLSNHFCGKRLKQAILRFSLRETSSQRIPGFLAVVYVFFQSMSQERLPLFDRVRSQSTSHTPWFKHDWLMGKGQASIIIFITCVWLEYIHEDLTSPTSVNSKQFSRDKKLTPCLPALANISFTTKPPSSQLVQSKRLAVCVHGEILSEDIRKTMNKLVCEEGGRKWEWTPDWHLRSLGVKVIWFTPDWPSQRSHHKSVELTAQHLDFIREKSGKSNETSIFTSVINGTCSRPEKESAETKGEICVSGAGGCKSKPG